MSNFLGIDWGGTYIKVGVVNPEGKLLRKITYSSESLKEKEGFVKKVEALVKEVFSFNIRAIGIGAPGIIDVKNGFIYYLPNIAGWKNYPLAKALKAKVKLPVFVDNDANLFALAEARAGAAKGKETGIFLTLGTGLGGAVIWKGKLLEARLSALELGHIPLDLKGKRCSCGGRGCIETFVGARYLLKRYQQLTSLKLKEAKELFLRAQNKEGSALKVWQEFSFALGKFLGGMVNVFNPEVIVLGGGIAGAFGLFKGWLLKAIKEQAMWPQQKGFRVVKAKLKEAGVIGAGLLAQERLNPKDENLY